MDLSSLFWFCVSFIIHLLGFIFFIFPGFSPSPSLVFIDIVQMRVTSSGGMKTSARSSENIKTVTAQKTHLPKPVPITRDIPPVTSTDENQSAANKGFNGRTSEASTSGDADAELEQTLANLLMRINELKKYPKIALLRRIEGVVLVSLLIYQSGEISQEYIQKSSGFLILDEEALRSVRELGETFPLPLGKKELRVEVPIRFKINLD